MRKDRKMRQMDLKALAKINLGLDVLGRRENGYHDVRMVMQSVYLYDNVRLEAREDRGSSFRPTCTISRMIRGISHIRQHR